MILAIDIGNSNIVLGGIENHKICFQARTATDPVKTSDQYCVEIVSILSLFKQSPDAFDGIIISSVVPQVLNSVKAAMKKLTGKPCLVVGPGLKTGLNIRIDNPAQVGSDLIVAAVAGVAEYGKPLMIIDMGTATTISVVSRDGAYVGGCICPGVRISMDALTGRTAQLPAISLNVPKKAIGTNTVDCMQSGIVLGTAGMLDGLLDRMSEELGCKPKILATGGLSEYIVPLCKNEIHYDGDLLLKGLDILYELNTK